MNKILKGLLVAVLAVGAAHADHHTNKTFLMPRPTGVDLPMEYTTFDELITRKAEDKFGGNFQVVPFYKDSNDDHELGEYFLFSHKHTAKLATIAAAPTNAYSAATDLDLGYIIHNRADATARSADLTLDPEQNSYGVRFDYHQDLDKLLKGLYLKVNLPVVHVENDPEIKVASSASFQAGLMDAATKPVKDTLEQYFRGDFANTYAANPNNYQDKLTHAKIAGHQDETGVADIDVALGYKILNKENYHLGLAIAITIPTGNDADGNHVFEAIVGNGGHFGLGGDLIAGARVWGDLDQNIKLYLKMKYRYLFESSETRTLGIKDYAFGQYHLLGKVGTASLIPAANVTTLDVDVTPGSQFDGILGFAYNNGGFTFDLGYNLYYREDEDLHRKGSITDNMYYVASRDYNTAVPFTAVVANVDGTVVADALVNNNSLDVDAAATPSQCTHSIYGGLGYSFKEWDTPLMLGLGGKYEFASENSAIEQWGIWGKIGIGF